MGNTHIISNTLELIDAIQGCNCEKNKHCGCNFCGVPNYVIKGAEDEQAKPRKLIKKKYKPSKLPPPIQIEPSSSCIMDSHSPSVDELIARVEPVEPPHHSFAYSWPSLSATASCSGSSSISECSPLSMHTVDMNTPREQTESPLNYNKVARVPKFADDEGTNFDSQLIFNFADRVDLSKENKEKKKKGKSKNKNEKRNKPRLYLKRHNSSMY